MDTSKEYPILFSTDMVKATLEDRKTQTRRVIKCDGFCTNCKEEVCSIKCYYGVECGVGCPYGKVGDRLWVRETWYADEIDIANRNAQFVWWKADNDARVAKWKPSIHMPRWASRITLEITDIQVERLQEISEKDCLKEGIIGRGRPHYRMDGYGLPSWSEEECCYPITRAFIKLWNSLAKKGYKWEDNPWVWVISFKKLKKGLK